MVRRSAGFVERSKIAVRNQGVTAAVTGAVNRLSAGRKLAWAQMDDIQELRLAAREKKAEVIAHLDTYLDTLITKISSRGGYVFQARTVADMQGYLVNLIRTKGIRTVVKGKSMVSEEAHLNLAMEAYGAEVFETDLGEYIVQLAGETPSHILGPAMHKTKEDIADLFSQKLGGPTLSTPEELTALARETLRRKFLTAGLGLTGVNLAVAETGTIVLLENEGNIRMSTTLPRIHVAVMGLEKIVPSFADLAVFLKLLPRTATGQKMPSYVSFINGPWPMPPGEGPEEFHLIILDNGRRRIAADPDLRSALSCIRCGACLNVCPVFRRLGGGHPYGFTYSGPIGAILAPLMSDLPDAAHLPFASTLCGACRDACPVMIDHPSLLLKLRYRIASQKNPSSPRLLTEKLLVQAAGRVKRHLGLYQAAIRVARLTRMLGIDSNGLVTRAGLVFRPPAPRTYREMKRHLNSKRKKNS
ncbi:MAG: lactate utilization protein [Deltaproteobacteria bacterium]|nr:lactate utilization protein [Deltaproteobacteria bacterium]